MTTLQNRPNTALLVIDVQNGVVAGNHERDSVVSNVATLVAACEAHSHFRLLEQLQRDRWARRTHQRHRSGVRRCIP